MMACLLLGWMLVGGGPGNGDMAAQLGVPGLVIPLGFHRKGNMSKGEEQPHQALFAVIQLGQWLGVKMAEGSRYLILHGVEKGDAFFLAALQPQSAAASSGGS